MFEGVNFEDNAGSSFQTLGELPINTQGVERAFLIGAQYAKPLLANPNGIGAGQAYLMYDNLPPSNRRYSLNAVGGRDEPGGEDDAGHSRASGFGHRVRSGFRGSSEPR